MGFESPAALGGLGLVLVLLLFSLWRSRPERILIASAAIWRRIPERAPPIRAARRPRWSWSLLLQALALSLLMGGAAQPYVRRWTPLPRRIAVVIDTSARMEARLVDGKTRFEGARTMLVDAARRLGGNDRMILYWIDDAPRRWEGPAEGLGARLASLRPVHHATDVAGLLAVAREEAPGGGLWWISDRPGGGTGITEFLAGEAPENTGIVTASVTGDELFARILRVGAARDVEIVLVVNGRESAREKVRLEPGIRSWWRKVGTPDARRLAIELQGQDQLRLDDRVDFVRFDPHEGVRMEGAEHPLLARALQSVPGVRLGQGRTAVLVRSLERAGETTIYVDPPAPPPGFEFGEEFTPQAWTPADHPLARSLQASELSSSAAREVRGGMPLLFADGRCVAAVNGRSIVLAFDLTPGGWSSTVSFPIFWTNVIDFARTHASWRSMRCGDMAPLPAGTQEVRGASSDAVFRFEPTGCEFVPQTVGEYEARAPGGNVAFAVSLLDETQSDTSGVARKGEPEPEGRGGATRAPIGDKACWVALAVLLLAWWVERKR